MYRWLYFATVFTLPASLACGEPPSEVNRPSAPAAAVRVDGERFVDQEGRQVFLHGLNVVSKSKDERYFGWQRRGDFAAMRTWGMNCIRLGILWDGLEPEPGKYDEAYLDGVAERLDWAAAEGLFVVLDMHQDLYSVRFGDGAPDWATLDEDKPHLRGAVWSDSYQISPAVQTAFDNFWANAAAPDGVGIQDHYAAAWRHVAQRFRGHPTVIGYDLMNEPFAGTTILVSQQDILRSEFAAELAQRLGDRVDSPAAIAQLWLSPQGRAVIMEQLDDPDLYRKFVDAQTKSGQEFERTRLQPMYQRVADAIRSVDERRIFFLEPGVQCNTGVRSGIEPLRGPDGQRDPQQAYAPHAYDIVVDTPAVANSSTQRVAFIFERHAETARRLKMPMLVGEWGAFADATAEVVPAARQVERQLAAHLCGDTYWDFGHGLDKQAYFPVLKRSVPCRVSGTLLEYANRSDTGSFICRWKEAADIAAPTIVYLTAEVLHGRSPRLEPPGAGFSIDPVAGGLGDAYLTIPPTGESIERTLSID